MISCVSSSHHMSLTTILTPPPPHDPNPLPHCPLTTVLTSHPSSGPEDTSFEGGVFITELIFPPDYPLSPPKMRFISQMFHPNGTSSFTNKCPLFDCFSSQCIKMVVCVYPSCILLVMIPWAMRLLLSGGVQCSPSRRYCSLLSVC